MENNSTKQGLFLEPVGMLIFFTKKQNANKLYANTVKKITSFVFYTPQDNHLFFPKDLPDRTVFLRGHSFQTV